MVTISDLDETEDFSQSKQNLKCLPNVNDTFNFFLSFFSQSLEVYLSSDLQLF